MPVGTKSFGVEAINGWIGEDMPKSQLGPACVLQNGCMILFLVLASLVPEPVGTRCMS